MINLSTSKNSKTIKNMIKEDLLVGNKDRKIYLPTIKEEHYKRLNATQKRKYDSITISDLYKIYNYKLEQLVPSSSVIADIIHLMEWMVSCKDNYNYLFKIKDCKNKCNDNGNLCHNMDPITDTTILELFDESAWMPIKNIKYEPAYEIFIKTYEKTRADIILGITGYNYSSESFNPDINDKLDDFELINFKDIEGKNIYDIEDLLAKKQDEIDDIIDPHMQISELLTYILNQLDKIYSRLCFDKDIANEIEIVNEYLDSKKD